MNLKSQIESLLLVAVKPISLKEMAAVTKSKLPDLEQAVAELTEDYRQPGRGLSLINHNGRYQLSTASDNAEIVKSFLEEESAGELSQPSLETLTIIAYRGPIAKPELDSIRGVNCSLIIRNLLLRGLIEEKFSKDKQENYYTVTHDFVRWLGLRELNELPDYQKLKDLTLYPLSAGEEHLAGK